MILCDARDCDEVADCTSADQIPSGWRVVRERLPLPDISLMLPPQIADAVRSFMQTIASVGEPPAPRWRTWVICPCHELPVQVEVAEQDGEVVDPLTDAVEEHER